MPRQAPPALQTKPVLRPVARLNLTPCHILLKGGFSRRTHQCTPIVAFDGWQRVDYQRDVRFEHSPEETWLSTSYPRFDTLFAEPGKGSGRVLPFLRPELVAYLLLEASPVMRLGMFANNHG